MDMQDQIHAVMNKDDAKLIAVGLGMVLTKVNYDLYLHTDESEQDMQDYLGMLNVKMAAEKMFTDIWNLVGVDEDTLQVMLNDTEWSDEELEDGQD